VPSWRWTPSERYKSGRQVDADLRRDNPEWGVRDTADLRRLAEANGLRLAELIEMPSNNTTLIFERIRSS
jgi:hypothetical protein